MANNGNQLRNASCIEVKSLCSTPTPPKRTLKAQENTFIGWCKESSASKEPTNRCHTIAPAVLLAVAVAFQVPLAEKQSFPPLFAAS